MKVKVYLNRVLIDWKNDFIKAKDYFKSKGLDITFDFQESDYKDLSSIEVQLVVGRRVFLQPYMANIVPMSDDYDFTMFVFNQEEFPTNKMPQGLCYESIKGIFIDIGTHRNNPKDLTYVEICHELMHALVKQANKKGFKIDDVMDTYWNNFFLTLENSNFGQQWKLLKTYLNSLKPKTGWKYFKPNEKTGSQGIVADLDPKLVDILDMAREIAGIPFIITSGYRTVAQNALVGGVMDSAHETGLAVDLLIKDGISGEKINSALHQVGIKRFGYYSDGHIHCDIDYSKPNPCYWVK